MSHRKTPRQERPCYIPETERDWSSIGGAGVVGWLWRGGQGSDAAGRYEELVILRAVKTLKVLTCITSSGFRFKDHSGSSVASSLLRGQRKKRETIRRLWNGPGTTGSCVFLKIHWV